MSCCLSLTMGRRLWTPTHEVVYSMGEKSRPWRVLAYIDLNLFVLFHQSQRFFLWGNGEGREETELGTPVSWPHVHLGTLLMVNQGFVDPSGFRTYFLFAKFFPFYETDLILKDKVIGELGAYTRSTSMNIRAVTGRNYILVLPDLGSPWKCPGLLEI